MPLKLCFAEVEPTLVDTVTQFQAQLNHAIRFTSIQGVMSGSGSVQRTIYYTGPTEAHLRTQAMTTHDWQGIAEVLCFS